VGRSPAPLEFRPDYRDSDSGSDTVMESDSGGRASPDVEVTGFGVAGGAFDGYRPYAVVYTEGLPGNVVYRAGYALFKRPGNGRFSYGYWLEDQGRPAFGPLHVRVYGLWKDATGKARPTAFDNDCIAGGVNEGSWVPLPSGRWSITRGNGAQRAAEASAAAQAAGDDWVAEEE
jgi:hypothetical protein